MWESKTALNTPENQPASLLTVFSTDESPYQKWQAELLVYSHANINQVGSVVRLLSSRNNPSEFLGDTFQVDPFCPHPETGDLYPPYNKPSALCSWLTTSPPQEEMLLLLDPDFIFLRKVEVSVARGQPVAQRISYMDFSKQPELISKHCGKPNRIQNIGVPIVIHRDDLANLAPLWLQKTEEIRNDPISLIQAGWVAEMWAYIFAAAELGVYHKLFPLAHWQSDNFTHLPLLHYCYTSTNDTRTWRWSKEIYNPWSFINFPTDGVPSASMSLFSLINEYSEKQHLETSTSKYTVR